MKEKIKKKKLKKENKMKTILKTTILTSLFLGIITSNLSATEKTNFSPINMGTNSYQEKNWSQVANNLKEKLLKLKKGQKNNLVSKMNERVKKIERQKRTTFTITAPRVLDVYVRESYLVLEDKFVIKNAPVWKRVLIKEKDIWEY
jgi:carboxylesterase type B